MAVITAVVIDKSIKPWEGPKAKIQRHAKNTSICEFLLSYVFKDFDSLYIYNTEALRRCGHVRKNDPLKFWHVYIKKQ